MLTNDGVWKNGVVHRVEYGSNNYILRNFTVNGNDIYVCGNSVDPVNGKPKAMYWKNGIPHLVSNEYHTQIDDITVTGNDLHLLMNHYDIVSGRADIQYWRNGSAITIGKGYGNAIAVLDNHFYIAGNEMVGSWTERKARYWINGVRFDLPGSDQIRLRSIFVKNR